MPRRETALVVDDDQGLRSLLSDLFHDAGFDVVQCSRGADAVAAVTRHSPLVVTLDIGLPDMDGFEALRRIRSRSSCYVLMVSARDDEMDLISSLQLGADEYITKPFRVREVRARVHAMLRRPRMATLPPGIGSELTDPSQAAEDGVGAAEGVAGPGTEVRDGADTADVAHRPFPPPSTTATRHRTLSHFGLVLDPAGREVTVDGRSVQLTRMEFDLLAQLMRARGAIMTKNALVRALRGSERSTGSPSGYVSAADEHALDVHMGNLRRKLGEKRGSPRWVMTVRGVGYRLSPGPSGH